MRIEIRDLKSWELIPETASDRAILKGWSEIDVTKFDIKCHRHIWGDGRIEKMVFGYVTKSADDDWLAKRRIEDGMVVGKIEGVKL